MILNWALRNAQRQQTQIVNSIPLKQGRVVQVSSDGTLLVSVDGGSQSVMHPTTDELIREGDSVWVMQASDGSSVVIGAVK